MALDPMAMKSKFKQRILNGLKGSFSNPNVTDGDKSLEQLADAISAIAIDLVEELTTKAMVAPGIPVATSGGPGATTGPGQIM